MLFRSFVGHGYFEGEGLLLLTRWKGYRPGEGPDGDDSWEPLHALVADVPAMVRSYGKALKQQEDSCEVGEDLLRACEAAQCKRVPRNEPRTTTMRAEDAMKPGRDALPGGQASKRGRRRRRGDGQRLEVSAVQTAGGADDSQPHVSQIGRAHV